nr:hypothetical protein [Acidimicrobiia bacterium]
MPSPVPHDAMGTVRELLAAVALRLRLAWGMATAGMVLPVALGLAVIVVLLGWVA